MRYASAGAFREALERRLNESSRQTGTNLERLRRRVAVERLLVRLAADGDTRWILKGGMGLEIRFLDRARATRDVDLAAADDLATAQAARRRLARAVGRDGDGDLFAFSVGEARPISPDEAGRAGWRLPVLCTLDGREFSRLRVDVVARTAEVAATEVVDLPDVLAFAGVPTAGIETVGADQHFAEKLHAYTRTYSGGRENTRVKDLVDLVLLIEVGLKPSTRLREVVAHVFSVRGTHPVPDSLPAPPAAWAVPYREMAGSVGLTSGRTAPEGFAVLSRFWAEARHDPEES